MEAWSWRKLVADNLALIERALVAPGELSTALQTLMRLAAPPAQPPPARPDAGSQNAASDERTFTGDVQRAPGQQSSVALQELEGGPGAGAALRSPARTPPMTSGHSRSPATRGAL
jgi:hypothetical protein